MKIIYKDVLTTKFLLLLLLIPLILIFTILSLTKRTYEVTFFDSDGTVLSTQTVEENQYPSFSEVPKKASDSQYDYVFKSWNKPLEPVTENVAYTANYDLIPKKTNATNNTDSDITYVAPIIENGESEVVSYEDNREYTVQFIDDDGTFLQTLTVRSGEMPIYTNLAPLPKVKGEYLYTFKGWDKEYTPVTDAQVYTAVYNKIKLTNSKASSINTEDKNTYYYSVKVTVSPNVNYGTVSGGGTYAENTVVVLEAKPKSGYEFLEWNDGDKNTTKKITVKTDCSFVARFGAIEDKRTKFTISTSSSDYSKGTVTGGAIYREGDTVTLTATPNRGYKFVKWNDGDTNPVKKFVVSLSNSAEPYVATFAVAESYTISAIPNVSSYGTCSGSGTYYEGDTITLNAYPNTNYRFSHWEDEPENTGRKRTITVSGNKTYKAVFVYNGFPSKNDTITLLDETTGHRNYLVLSADIDNGNVTLLSRDSLLKTQASGKNGYGDIYKQYKDSALDKLCDQFYNELSPKTQSAIVETSVNSYIYVGSEGAVIDNRYNQFYYPGILREEKDSSNNVLPPYSRKVIVPDLFDIERYFGATQKQAGSYTISDLNKFFNADDPRAYSDFAVRSVVGSLNDNKVNVVDKGIIYFSETEGFVTSTLDTAGNVKTVRPMFTINLFDEGLNYINDNNPIEYDNVSPVTHNVSITASENGTIENTLEGRVTHGTLMMPEAKANESFMFFDWSDGVKDPVHYVPVIDDVNLSALFTQKIYEFTVKVDDSCKNYGSVEVSSNRAFEGGEITITAKPKAGYRFDEWSDGNKNPVRVISDINDSTPTTYIAKFSLMRLPAKGTVITINGETDNHKEYMVVDTDSVNNTMTLISRDSNIKTKAEAGSCGDFQYTYKGSKVDALCEQFYNQLQTSTKNAIVETTIETNSYYFKESGLYNANSHSSDFAFPGKKVSEINKSTSANVASSKAKVFVPDFKDIEMFFNSNGINAGVYSGADLSNFYNSVSGSRYAVRSLYSDDLNTLNPNRSKVIYFGSDTKKFFVADNTATYEYIVRPMFVVKIQSEGFTFNETTTLVASTAPSITKTINLYSTTGGKISVPSGSYTLGTLLNITASATNDYYYFDKWSDSDTITNTSRYVLVDNDKELTARFIRDYYVTVSVAAECNGMGEVSISNSGNVKTGGTIKITATPNPGHRFIKWDDGSTEKEREITNFDDSKPLHYIAYFEARITPIKGDTISIIGESDNHKEYLVLDVDTTNNNMLIISKDSNISTENITTPCGDFQYTYKGSKLDLLCEQFYNDLQSSTKNAIIETTLDLNTYYYDNTLNIDNSYSSKFAYPGIKVDEIDKVSSNKAEASKAKVYVPDLKDVETFFGATSTNAGAFSKDDLKTFFSITDGNTNDYVLRSLFSDKGSDLSSDRNKYVIYDSSNSVISSVNHSTTAKYYIRPMMRVKVTDTSFKYNITEESNTSTEAKKVNVQFVAIGNGTISGTSGEYNHGSLIKASIAQASEANFGEWSDGSRDKSRYFVAKEGNETINAYFENTDSSKLRRGDFITVNSEDNKHNDYMVLKSYGTKIYLLAKDHIYIEDINKNSGSMTQTEINNQLNAYKNGLSDKLKGLMSTENYYTYTYNDDFTTSNVSSSLSSKDIDTVSAYELQTFLNIQAGAFSRSIDPIFNIPYIDNTPDNTYTLTTRDFKEVNHVTLFSYQNSNNLAVNTHKHTHVCPVFWIDLSKDTDNSFSYTKKGNYITSTTNRTIKFKDGDNELQSNTLAVGMRITSPTGLLKEGFIFGGWEPTLPDFVPDEDMAFSVKWVSNFDNGDFITINSEDNEHNDYMVLKTDGAKVYLLAKDHIHMDYIDKNEGPMTEDDINNQLNAYKNGLSDKLKGLISTENYNIYSYADSLLEKSEVIIKSSSNKTIDTVSLYELQESLGFNDGNFPNMNTIFNIPVDKYNITTRDKDKYGDILVLYSYEYFAGPGTNTWNHTHVCPVFWIDLSKDTDNSFSFTKCGNYKTSTTNRTIKFKDGDTELQSNTLAVGVRITPPTGLLKEGFIFGGWEPTLPDFVPDEDMTFSVKWIENNIHKGSIIKLNDNKEYRVLSLDGSKAKVMAMYDDVTSKYSDGATTMFTNETDSSTIEGLKYEGSTLDNYLEQQWYAGLNTGNTIPMYNAIEKTNINQCNYVQDMKKPDASVKYYTYQYFDEYRYRVYRGSVSVGKRHVYALGYEEIFEYLDTNTLLSNQLMLLFFNQLSSVDKRIWLNTASDSHNYPLEVLKEGYITGSDYYYRNVIVRPTFAIDLAGDGVTFSKVNPEIIFDTDGGSFIQPISQVKDTDISAMKPADPTKPGYTFIGWDKTIPNTMPGEDMVIKAKWKSPSSLEDIHKGSIIKLNDNKEYRVLSLDGSKAKVMAMYDNLKTIYSNAATTMFTNESDSSKTEGLKYEGSSVDNILNNTWYNNLSSSMKNAIIQTNVVQKMYIYEDEPNDPLDFKDGTITYKSQFGGESDDYDNYTYKGKVDVGSRYVYALGLEDIYDYFDTNTLTSNEKHSFFYNEFPYYYNEDAATREIWLNSAASKENALGHGDKDTWFFDNQAYGNDKFVRPSFTINLTGDGVIFSKERPEIIFDTDGGNFIQPISQAKDTDISAMKPADPTKPGCTFIGWDKTIPDTMPGEDMVIKAKWKLQCSLEDIHKGSIIKLNDNKEYRVLSLNGSIAKVMAMYDDVSSKYSETGATTTFINEYDNSTTTNLQYKGSTLDNYLEEQWYNGLNTGNTIPMYNAIRKTNINQSSYEYGNSQIYPVYNLATYPYYYNGKASVGDRHVYALDMEDFIDYFDKTQISLLDISFMILNSSDKKWYGCYYIFATTYTNVNGNYVLTFDPYYERFAGMVVSKTTSIVRPSFAIDLAGEGITIYKERPEIIFDTDGGNFIQPISQAKDTDISAMKPADPTRPGYTFIGWDKTIPNTMPGEDLVIKAKWEMQGDYNYKGIYKGSIIKLNDNKEYRVLSLNGSIVKVMAMYDDVTSKYSNGTQTEFTNEKGDKYQGIKYEGSTLDNYLNNDWYSNLPSSMKNAIIQTNVVQKKYLYNDIDGPSTYKSQFGSSETNFTTYTYYGSVNAIQRYVYELGLEDIFDYFDKNTFTSNEQNSFFFNIFPFVLNQISKNIWLNSSVHRTHPSFTGNCKYPYIYEGERSFISDLYYADECIVRPTFTINLTGDGVTFSKVNPEIIFDTDGGNFIQPISQAKDTDISAMKPANPTRDGFTFIGWDKEIPNKMPATDMVIKAKWKYNPTKGDLLTISGEDDKYNDYVVLKVDGDKVKLALRDEMPTFTLNDIGINDAFDREAIMGYIDEKCDEVKNNLSSSLQSAMVETDYESVRYTSSNLWGVGGPTSPMQYSNKYVCTLSCKDIEEYLGTSLTPSDDLIKKYASTFFLSDSSSNIAGRDFISMFNRESISRDLWCDDIVRLCPVFTIDLSKMTSDITVTGNALK